MAKSALAIAFVIGALAGGPAGASADYSSQTLALTARAISFVKDRANDNIRIAIVSDPNVSESAEEAEHIRAIIGTGLVVANMHLTVVDVPVDEIDKAAGSDVIWITKGLDSGEYQRIAKIADRAHAVSVSSDLDCAQSGYCVLGIQARPSVRILLSSVAATKAGISFQPAFRMMVTEL